MSLFLERKEPVRVYSADEVDDKLAVISLTPGPQGEPGPQGPSGVAAPIQRFNKRHNWPSHVFRAGSRLADLTTDFEITAPAHVAMSGFQVFRHRGGEDGIIADLPVGVSIRIGYRRADTLAGLGVYPAGARTLPLWNTAPTIAWVPGSKVGANLVNLRQHYLDLPLAAQIELAPGAFRFEVWAFAHTAIEPFTERDDLVCVNTDTNQTEDDTFGHLATTITPL